MSGRGAGPSTWKAYPLPPPTHRRCLWWDRSSGPVDPRHRVPALVGWVRTHKSAPYLPRSRLERPVGLFPPRASSGEDYPSRSCLHDDTRCWVWVTVDRSQVLHPSTRLRPTLPEDLGLVKVETDKTDSSLAGYLHPWVESLPTDWGYGTSLRVSPVAHLGSLHPHLPRSSLPLRLYVSRWVSARVSGTPVSTGDGPFPMAVPGCPGHRSRQGTTLSQWHLHTSTTVMGPHRNRDGRCVSL